MAVEVKPVASRSELNAFIRLPWQLYRGEPNWVPPLLMDVRKRLDRKRTRSSSTPRPNTSWPGVTGGRWPRERAH
jgi:hypothetical protein